MSLDPSGNLDLREPQSAGGKNNATAGQILWQRQVGKFAYRRAMAAGNQANSNSSLASFFDFASVTTT
jgi:hypothetical protein